jgi:flavin reductase (DIM6/NTAB) family NADH-FMN oxidoreductase RutF
MHKEDRVADLDKRALRNAFGSFMTGVTVVTTLDANKAPIGFTANSFTSVSLDPPLLLISLAKSSSNLANFQAAEGFAVNILNEQQRDAANVFASRVEDRFAKVAWYRSPQGRPLLKDVCAWFDCSMHQQVEAGDHLLLIGRIEAFDQDLERDGLGYVRGAFYHPSLIERASASLRSDQPVSVTAVIDREDKVYLEEEGDGTLRLPRLPLNPGEGHPQAYRRLLGKLGLTASIGFLFSVYADAEGHSQTVAYRCVSEDGTPLDGRFYAQEEIDFDRLADADTHFVLQRYFGERSRGNYGVYFSNHVLSPGQA